MIKLKLSAIIIGLLIGFSANAQRPVTLCLTGKLELTLPEYKMSFINAVNLAQSHNAVSKQVHIKTYFYDNKPLSAIRVYNEMLHDHCSAIVGFEYLSDLLLIEKIQLDHSIPIFTSYASSNDLDTMPNNFFIFMPSYDYQAKKMMDYLHGKFSKINKVLIITEVDRADLAKYKIAYESILNKEGIHYDQMDFIGDDNLFEEKLTQFLINKSYDFVFLFSGAVGSTKIINQMNDHKITFIGTENFGSSTNQSLYVRLNDKKIKALTIRNIDFLKRSKELEVFVREYVKKYSILPSPLSAYTYDAVMIILKAFEANRSVTTENILKINYDGITGAYIKDKKFHRSNQYVILSIGEKGFVHEE